jgi:hypothetical protein
MAPGQPDVAPAALRTGLETANARANLDPRSWPVGG